MSLAVLAIRVRTCAWERRRGLRRLSLCLASAGIPNPDRGVIADLDDDGDDDLVVFGAEFVPGPFVPFDIPLTAFENLGTPGTPSFSPAAMGIAPGRTDAVTVIDLDDDGVKDLLTVSTTGPLTELTSYRANGAFSYSVAPLESGLDTIKALSSGIAADFNGDGRDDFAVFDSLGFRILTAVSDIDAHARGSVAASSGPPVDVLFIDGSAGGSSRHFLRVPGQPFSVLLSPAPATPNPTFVLWGSVGPRTPWRQFDSPFGQMSFMPHVLDPGSSELFTLANSISVDPLALLPASAGTFVFNSPGLPIPLTFTLQGLTRDSSSASLYSVTNAVTMTVE